MSPMKKIILLVLMVASVSHADVTPGSKPMVFRAGANEYAIPGEGTLHTVNCTVTADGTLAAKVVGGRKPWLYFYDRNGEREADCQLLTKPVPVVIVKRERIHRGIATVASR